MKNINKLKKTLNKLHSEFDFKTYIRRDPIEFLHRYKNPRDIEVVGLIASSLAYGRIELFKPVIEKILDVMGRSPYKYIKNYSLEQEAGKFKKLNYRMTRGIDIACMIYGIHLCIKEYGSLKKLFYHGYEKSDGENNILLEAEHRDIKSKKKYGIAASCGELNPLCGIKRALTEMTRFFHSIDTSPVYGKKIIPRSYLFLFPSPSKGSPCKRLNLFLRWMVRNGDGVDFGIWDKIPASELIIPLDIHISRAANHLSLTKRKNPSWEMAREITENLKLIDPDDPVKFDFSLCHLTMAGKIMT